MNLNYNNSITDIISEYVKRIISYIPAYDKQERKISIDKYIVDVDDDTDLYAYIKNELTCEFVIHYYYTVYCRDGSSYKDEFELRIPKLINNVFVIEGKLRIPTTTLGSDSECRVYKGEVTTIQFDYQRKVQESEGWGMPKIIIQEEFDEAKAYDATAENFEMLKYALKLTQRQKYKLQVKLNVDNVGDYITEELCRQLINSPEDRYEDSIVDKIFINPENSLMRFIYQHKSKVTMMAQMRKKFYKYGHIYPSDLQKIITSYFKVASESTIEIPQNVNTLVYNSLSSKLIVPKFVAYNKSFADLIDPVNTPENGNVNRINELNICTEIVNGEPYIWCYKYPTFEKVRLDYLEYLNSKVVSNVCVNYKKKTIDLSKGKYKLRLHEYPLTVQPSGKGWLIEPKPDEKLSITTRQIPLVNVSDTVRVAMGAGMSKQAVELENSEPCLVSSGNEIEDEKFDTSRRRWSGEPGTVVAITEGNIMVKLDSNDSVVNFDIPDTTVGLNNTLISHVVKVKVGDKVEDGTLMLSSYMTKNKTYELGVNAHVAYAFYKGYNHEDAIIISESFAKRTASYQIIDVSIDLSCFDYVHSIIPMFTKVSSKDLLVNKTTRFRPKGQTEALLNSQTFLFLKDALSTYNSNVEVPNNIEEGFLTDIAVNLYPDWEQIAKNNKAEIEKLKPCIEYLLEYEEHKDDKRALTSIPELPERYKAMRIKESPIDDKNYELIGTINLRIVKYSPAHKGSKFCNRWGSKGEVSLVLPDDQMLRDENGKIFDMILNPPSIIKRKNPAQLIEALLSKVVEKVYKDIYPLAMNDKADEIRKELEEFYGDQFDDFDDVELCEGIKKSKSFLAFKVGSISDYGRDKVLEIAKKAGVEDKEYVTDPDPEIGELENPVITGENYYLRLYHSADYTAKVTSSIEDEHQPILGHGEYRAGGQKFGEMENWALMSHGVQQYFNPEVVQKEGTFLNELLLAGYSLYINGNPALMTENSKQMSLIKK